MNQELIDSFVHRIYRRLETIKNGMLIFNENKRPGYVAPSRRVYFQGIFEDPIIVYFDLATRKDNVLLTHDYIWKHLLKPDTFIRMIKELPEPSFKDTHLMVDEDTINFRYQ